MYTIILSYCPKGWKFLQIFFFFFLTHNLNSFGRFSLQKDTIIGPSRSLRLQKWMQNQELHNIWRSLPFFNVITDFPQFGLRHIMWRQHEFNAKVSFTNPHHCEIGILQIQVVSAKKYTQKKRKKRQQIASIFFLTNVHP